MLFTITSYNFLLGIEPNYRLQKDGSWKKISKFNECNIDTDMTFSSHIDAVRWLKRNENQYINGIECCTNPYQGGKVGDKNRYFFEILTHRKTKPHLFTRNELKEVLKNGDDTVHNSLYIDFDGFVKLKNITNNGDFIGYDEYAVRNESYDAFNGYVGEEFEDEYINNLYLNILDEWCSHLSSGRSLYIDYDKDNLDEPTILAEINQIISNLDN